MPRSTWNLQFVRADFIHRIFLSFFLSFFRARWDEAVSFTAIFFFQTIFDTTVYYNNTIESLKNNFHYTYTYLTIYIIEVYNISSPNKSLTVSLTASKTSKAYPIINLTANVNGPCAAKASIQVNLLHTHTYLYTWI